jgi:hypothetical protein
VSKTRFFANFIGEISFKILYNTGPRLDFDDTVLANPIAAAGTTVQTCGITTDGLRVVGGSQVG